MNIVRVSYRCVIYTKNCDKNSTIIQWTNNGNMKNATNKYFCNSYNNSHPRSGNAYWNPRFGAVRTRRAENQRAKHVKERQIFGIRDCYLDLIVDVANRDLLPVSTTCRDHRWTWGATGIATMVRLMCACALFAKRFGDFFRFRQKRLTWDANFSRFGRAGGNFEAVRIRSAQWRSGFVGKSFSFILVRIGKASVCLKRRSQYSLDLCLSNRTYIGIVFYWVSIANQSGCLGESEIRLADYVDAFRLFSALVLYYFISLYVFFKTLHCPRSLSPTTVIHFGIFQAWLRRERVALTVGLEFLSRRDINLYTCTLLKRSNEHTFSTPFLRRHFGHFIMRRSRRSHKLLMRNVRMCATINVAYLALLWLLRYRGISFNARARVILINPFAPILTTSNKNIRSGKYNIRVLFSVVGRPRGQTRA